MENEFTVLDMFAGAGGLSEGFFRTGYKFISHIEMDKYASMTLETRAIYHALKANGLEDYYYGYIAGDFSREDLLQEGKRFSDLNSAGIINSKISAENEEVIIRRIEKTMETHNLKKTDVIIGGPPCQAYSIVGRSRDSEKMKKDPRNYLYLCYLSFIRSFKPDIFVFENVLGIKTARNGEIYHDFLARAGKLGYTIREKILNAADFLVLQRRKRVIVIGWKAEYDLEYPSFTPIEHNYTVSSLLEDLPSLKPGEGNESPQEYIRPPARYLEESGLRSEKDILIQHSARRHNERDREIYKYVISVWNNEHRRVKYDELPERLKTHRNRESFEDRFKVVAPDLKYAQTITAHISKDGHYYIHPDIAQARSITVREAARIQSFPDNFKFEGPRTSQYTQVGNAVPPLMAERIAVEIEKMLGAI
ncbi:DNA (cytosine-5-)-methyltransferase [Candidatus Bathyarchaeota archaeon]|nr:MAG: DNA (cytosine-5-)-methyltransferase [Candidatus Bathyarchaeota archaeon]RLI54248.1 MAG: DNA (cytosine-5-)-methyltransferase [Candidatus Thorarchaeota archaeon]